MDDLQRNEAPPVQPERAGHEPRGGVWVLVLGCVLAVLGLLREPAHSQQGGGDGNPTPSPGPTVTMPMTPGGTADSNDRMIAVTGVDITGSSILYVIDTLDPHIAVYQATGGSPSMNAIRLVAARRIDLDLKLDGFNDSSVHRYKDLHQTFSDQGLLEGDD
jgi:hypothetical protein